MLLYLGVLYVLIRFFFLFRLKTTSKLGSIISLHTHSDSQTNCESSFMGVCITLKDSLKKRKKTLHRRYPAVFIFLFSSQSCYYRLNLHGQTALSSNTL